MADVTISNLNALTPSTGLELPVSDGSTTGKVTLSQVCGVMTLAQITSALGYTPLGELPVGSVAKVIQTTTSTQIAIANTETDIGLSGTITLSKSTNKVLCMSNIAFRIGNAYQNTCTASVGLKRGSTRIAGSADATGFLYQGAQGSATGWGNYVSFNYLDTPGTIGPHTYSHVMREITAGASGSSYAQISNTTSYFTLMEIVG